jgi:arylsulfatase A-like enzyme
LADDRTVTSEDTWLLNESYFKTPLIVLGSAQDNRVMHALGTRFLLRSNRTWPGGDRFLMWAGKDADPEDLHECRLASAAVRTIREFARAGGPWLVEVHFPQPHDSYVPIMQFLERYPLEDVELPSSYYEETFEGKPGLLAREAGCWAELSEEQFRQGLRHYYAYCEQLDHFAGMVLDALEETGQAGETLAVLGCDHGDMAGAHRMFIKGWMPYEETHRIPMAARWPGVIPAGKCVSAPVAQCDLFPTILDYLGIPAPPDPRRAGRSYAAFLRGQSPRWQNRLYFDYAMTRAIRTENLKFVDRTREWPSEMFDLEADPGETKNVIDDPRHRRQLETLRADLDRFFERSGAPPIDDWRKNLRQKFDDYSR